jgi:hypothetical protein
MQTKEKIKHEIYMELYRLAEPSADFDAIDKSEKNFFMKYYLHWAKQSGTVKNICVKYDLPAYEHKNLMREVYQEFAPTSDKNVWMKVTDDEPEKKSGKRIRINKHPFKEPISKEFDDHQTVVKTNTIVKSPSGNVVIQMKDSVKQVEQQIDKLLGIKPKSSSLQVKENLPEPKKSIMSSHDLKYIALLKIYDLIEILRKMDKEDVEDLKSRIHEMLK